jgi:hypothetical protein
VEKEVKSSSEKSKCGKPSKEYSKTAALPDGFSVFS